MTSHSGFRTVAASALLVALCFSVYANNYEHDYLLDSASTIRGNLAIRDLGNLPAFFWDPSHASALRQQVDYRPVLLTSYALNYRLGGYDTHVWHFTQVLLHALCTLGLFAFFLRVLGLAMPESNTRLPIALLGALVFAIHPANSGVVNYLNARSTLLTATFLIWSICLYLVSVSSQRYRRVPWASAALFALALFTKVEAIAALGVFFCYEVWQASSERGGRRGFFASLRATLQWGTLIRIGPMLAIAVAYFAVRIPLMAPYDLAGLRAARGVSVYEHLLTQTVAWWYYVARWFAPVNLIADDASFPVYTTIAGPVFLSILGWLVVGVLLAMCWRTRPELSFLAISALALISPTSSIVVGAEMVNEHRPYLAVGVLSLAWMAPAGAWIFDRPPASRGSRAALALALTAILVGLFVLTWQRNRVFSTHQSYWGDIIAKAPSARAYLNYGRELRKRKDYARASDHFKRALDLAPDWYIAHINLALVYENLGRRDLALKHHGEAVRHDRVNGTALTHRGEFYLRTGNYAGALSDFEESQKWELDRYRTFKGLATAAAGLGDARKSFEYTVSCIRLAPQRAAKSIPSIAAPYFAERSKHASGIQYYELLAETIPGAWWAYDSIKKLARLLGDEERARAAGARSDAIRRREGLVPEGTD